jgi:hypothetical protein
MDVERIIDEIEQLQEIFEAPDIRPLSASDISAANRRHDEMLAQSPCFRLCSILASAADPNPLYSARGTRELSSISSSTKNCQHVAMLSKSVSDLGSGERSEDGDGWIPQNFSLTT